MIMPIQHNRHLYQTVTPPPSFIDEWQTWASSINPISSERRDIALSRLIHCLQQQGHELNLSHLNLSQLPASLPPTVKILHAGANQLSQLVDPLPPLTQLHLRGNQLHQLPENLPATLAILDISDNALTQLPAIMPPALKRLNADNNKMNTLPIDYPMGLIKLQVANNQLIQLPESLPSSLQELDVSGNALTRVLVSLPTGLKQLYMSDNQLVRLPDHLPNQLEIVHANNNKLRDLPSKLPISLRRLEVGNNRLSGLPSALPQGLHILNVNSNRLIKLPTVLPVSLKELYVCHNLLTELPAVLPPTLEILHAVYNRLTDEVKKLPLSLIDCNLDHNLIGLVPPATGCIDPISRPYFMMQPAQIDAYPSIQDHPYAWVLGDFLPLLISDERQSSVVLRYHLLNLLDYVRIEPSLREPLSFMANEASRVGINRISFYFNRMYLAILEDKLTRSQPSLNELISVNRGFFRLQILEKIAAHDAVCRRQLNTDFDQDIELYFDYQCLLQHILSLPVQTTREPDEVINHINTSELITATVSVLEQEKRDFIYYLVMQSTSWSTRLKQWNDNKVVDRTDSALDHPLNSAIRTGEEKEPTEALFYQQRYQLSRQFLDEHQALDLMDDFDHPDKEENHYVTDSI